jgi:hypothetical protein
MKKIFSFLFLTITALILESCQKEINWSTGTPAAVTGDFRAKIDGIQWVANSAAGAYRIGGFISISGRSTDKKYLTITLTDSGVYKYTLDDMSFNAASYIDSNLASPINFTTNQGINPGDAGGTLDITSIDTVKKKISGTFTFKVFRQSDGLQRTMTQGSFTNLSYATTLPPTSGTDTFNVKIAGALWTPPTVVAVKTPSMPPLTSQIVITGMDATGSKAVGLFMPSDIIPGTYTLDFFGLTYIGQYNPDSNPSNSQASTSGTLTILSHNTTTRRIRGNFSFHGETILPPVQTTELTEGFFAVTY